MIHTKHWSFPRQEEIRARKETEMNVVALCLVYASLVTAGFFTRSPERHNSKTDATAVKEGVVIGFEEENGKTKVSVSPQGSHHEVKEKIRLEASSSVVPDVMKKGDSGNQEEEVHHKFRPGEVVCDAYGKCKDKIGSYMGRTKQAAEKKANEAEKEAKEAVRDAVGKVKDAVAHTAQEMKESAKDAASEVSRKAKDTVAEEASEMKEGAKEKAREKAKEAEEMVKSASERAKHKVKKEAKKGMKGVFAYMVSPLRMASLTGVLHLMGFAAAYGMCVWVTFALNYVLAGALPRHQFAMVQSKIYPLYFKAMASSVGMALIGHMMGQRKRFSTLDIGMFRGFNLMASLVMILVNLLYLEPRATKVMFERMKKEKVEGEQSGGAVDSAAETAAGRGETGRETTSRGEKQEESAGKPQDMRSGENPLRRLNSYSSLLNVATLMSLTWHLVHLGQHLHALC